MIPVLIYSALATIQKPQAPQILYVANLSATDGRDAGAYYTVTPTPMPYPITQPVAAPVPMQDNCIDILNQQ